LLHRRSLPRASAESQAVGGICGFGFAGSSFHASIYGWLHLHRLRSWWTRSGSWRVGLCVPCFSRATLLAAAQVAAAQVAAAGGSGRRAPVRRRPSLWRRTAQRLLHRGGRQRGLARPLCGGGTAEYLKQMSGAELPIVAQDAAIWRSWWPRARRWKETSPRCAPHWRAGEKTVT